jgi:tetratricopeptide (TPR) repeat protein
MLVVVLGFCGFMGIAAFQQISVWKNSGTLWSHAIETYPNSYMARTNRAQYLSAKEGKYDEALADFAIALQVEPNDSFSLINRATIYINQQNFQAAYADADSLVKYVPHIAKGHYLRAVAAFRLNQPEQALADLTNCIQLDPASEEGYSYRGVVYYNYKQDYNAAKADFDQAILLDPKKVRNYKNRARCWIKFGKKTEALNDIAMAQSLGENVGNDLLQAAQALP